MATKRRLLSTVGVCIFAALPAAAFAQDNTASTPDCGGTGPSRSPGAGCDQRRRQRGGRF